MLQISMQNPSAALVHKSAQAQNRYSKLPLNMVALSLALLCSLPSQAINNTRPDSAEANIEAIILRQSEAWNQGNLVQFMAAYWKDERLTFSSGGETFRGWQATLERYQGRYPNQKIMGKLTFSNLETQLLGPDSALTLGRWQLARENPAGGNFSLVWKKVDDNWVIIHDHSSSFDPKK